MKFRRILSMMFASILVIVICVSDQPGMAWADENSESVVITPQYTHTKKVVAQLWSGSPGKATCSGEITVYDTTSTISMTVRLLKKSGSAWREVASWSGSKSGSLSYTITRDRSITSGTYKVKVTGTITTADGKSESVSKSTTEKVF